MPAGLPNFQQLVLDVYEQLDEPIYRVLVNLPRNACQHCYVNLSGLEDYQAAEVKRFINGDYDVVLGMLERRMDLKKEIAGKLRRTVAQALRKPEAKPAATHRALMRLADRGGAITIITTNFDLLLEDAAKKIRPAIQTYTLSGIPRPTRGEDFAGVLHIHGVLDRKPERISDFIVTDQDFGEFYLRRRVVPDFIYDAARLFHLVLVGYSANDAPMRYLLNAVAADSTHFPDLKERFSFVGSTDKVELEDWKGRGITPIPYDPADGHTQLHKTLQRWAALVDDKAVDAEIKRIVRRKWSEADYAERDLFDHLIRRSDSVERVRLSALASKQKADIAWLDAIVEIVAENKDRPS